MSKLAAALAAPKKIVRGPECAVKQILARVDDVDRKALENALRLDSGITGQQIADALTDEGYPVKAHTLQRHRNGRCYCAV